MPTVDELAKDLSDLKAKTDASIADIKKKVDILPDTASSAFAKRIIIGSAATIATIFGAVVASVWGAGKVYQGYEDRLGTVERSTSAITESINQINNKTYEISNQLSELRGEIRHLQAQVDAADAGTQPRGNFHNYWCDVDNHDIGGWRGIQTTNRSDGSQMWFYAIPDRGIVQGTASGPVDAGAAPDPSPVIATSRTSWGLSPPGAHVGLNVTINGRWFCYEYVDHTLRPTDCRFTDAGAP